MNIRLLKREEIEKDRWNGCVHYAHNGNLFGYLWYLDQVAKDWEALVEDEYHSVFPLVYKPGRWAGRQLHQPDLMREMGIYSVRALSEARVRAFLEAIPDDYRKVDIQVSRKNRLSEHPEFSFSKDTNYVLDLRSDYESLSDRFSAACFSRLDRAQAEGLLPLSGAKPERIAGFAKRWRPGLDEFALMRIMYNLLHRGWGFASAIHDPSGNWLAAYFFVYSHGRVISLAFAESPEGKEKGAGTMLYNLLLRSHAGRPLLLDFNTSRGNLAESFGGQSQPYFRLQKDKRLLGIF